MTSRCVPGVSTCLSCETRRVGTGCGRARSRFCFFSRFYIPGLEDDPSIRTGGIRVRMGSHSPGAATLRHQNFFLPLAFGRGFLLPSRFFEWLLDCTALAHNERARMQIDGCRRRVVCADSPPSKPSVSPPFTALGRRAGFCVDLWEPSGDVRSGRGDAMIAFSCTIFS
ncbi:hypothetical protein HETIRDRAFT_382357 [Heterobasidion irregulare TC 32-1]|uniref:Uncharacterized protein n=1 Tax=Heterobasidion irregulare (strain TC 32-1) TaxID=747525 RepID=W4KG47_HETIT|nr:uncharacterized protein HETIRDRAFT_382357 [Heterobasidion irregulare TC 32-1]ETW84709.1 hypothetical protein HETIRDRAFT_382357 [Heterobasidion irregulare TC 32-1]